MGTNRAQVETFFNPDPGVWMNLVRDALLGHGWERRGDAIARGQDVATAAGLPHVIRDIDGEIVSRRFYAP